MPGPSVLMSTEAEDRDAHRPRMLDHLALAAIAAAAPGRLLPGPSVIGGDDIVRWGGWWFFWFWR